MKLGTYGSICLITTLIITKVFISTPALYVQHSLSAGWLEVLLSGLFEILILFIILKLMSIFDGDIIDISNKVFGKAGRILTGSISLIVVGVCCAAVARSFAELIRNTIIRGHSYESIIFYVILCAILAAFFGIHSQVNLNGLIIPWVGIAIVIILLINLSRYSITNIQPVFGNGLTNVFKNALLRNASYFELGIILFITPFLRDKRTVKQISFTALSLSISIVTLVTLTYQLAVPYEAAKTFAIPLYQMTRMLKAGTFFQRIEPLNIFLWGSVMLIYTGVGLWLIAHIFKKTFTLSDDKPMIYIFAVIIGILALLPGSETSVERIYSFLMTYSYIAYPLIPLVFLILASLFSKNKSS